MAPDEGTHAAHRLLQQLGPWHCCVKRWASQIPTEPALVWLNGQANIVTQKTFEELDSEATKLAVMLSTTYGCKPGDRLILCYPPGVDFVVAFVACQMLGVVAVPLYFPMQTHRNKNVHSLMTLVRKARASQFLLTSSACKQSILADGDVDVTGGVRLQWVFSDEVIQDVGEGSLKSLREFKSSTNTGPTDVAFMQFSSGSTGTPKGCLITQAGFLHNIHHNWCMSGIYCSTRKKAIYDIPLEEYTDFTEDFQKLAVHRWGHRLRFVSWLPVTHDMGLVGMIGVPLFFGCTAYFMSPLEFLRAPSAWLEAFCRHQCSFTAAPDFAYALASIKVPDAVVQHLSFKKALAFINGAEPIRQRTLDLFASKFGECGFEPWMMCPAYGLAENTVGVTGRGHDGVWPRAPRVLKVRRDKLFPGDTVCPIPFTEPSNDVVAFKTVVGCGCPYGDVIVKIVHPESLKELSQWHVGEVWVSSPSCALGYFDDPAATTATFEAQLNGAFRSETAALKYLRTGDLGFVGDGELYITGRLKNILIVRGQNFYLQDFEEVVEKCAYIRKGCAMAFPVRSDETGLENLGVAAEVERSVTLLAELQAIAEQVRRSISQTFQLPVHCLWLTEAGTLPKTTSGKPRREAARMMLEKASCQGVLYCSHQPYNALDLSLPQNRQFCKKPDFSYGSTVVKVETDQQSAFLPQVQNTLYVDSRQMTVDASVLHSDAACAPVQRGKRSLVTSDPFERAVFDCFKEVFANCDLPIEKDTPLGALNLDSLSAVELAAALTRKLNVELQPFIFFDCPNVGSVVTTVKSIFFREDSADRPPAGQLVDLKHKPQYEIYITGMACKLPRGCEEPANFWTRLLQRDQFIGTAPPGRYPRFCSYSTTSAATKHNDQLRKWQGGFVNDITLFDNHYFGICAAEAAAMDPHQRLLLMQTVEALSSRGDSTCTPRHTGVFVGCCSEDWQRLNSSERSQDFTATAQSKCMLANRISYCMNLTGPSVTLDTACSSSLVALHCAWQEMTAGGTERGSTVDSAIVAAVNLMLAFDTTLALQRSGFLSQSYRCRTFDAAADGFVRSEGAAAVVLEKIWQTTCERASAVSPVFQENAGHRVKPSVGTSVAGSESVLIPKIPLSGGSCVTTETAVMGKEIGIDMGNTTTENVSLSETYSQEVPVGAPDPSQHCETGSATPETPRANVRKPRKAWCRLVATAVVHGGKTASVTAPCRASQEQLCRRSLSLAGAAPDEICYIETHGTGTALGDPIEVAAIVNVFKSNTFPRTSPLILGAVKTNLGHLEGAAGMAGLLKCALCLAHDKVPANLHLKTLNPYIDFRDLPVVLPCKTMPLTLTPVSLSGDGNQCNTMGLANRNRFECAPFGDRSSTAYTNSRLDGSRCIVTSLGFGGTYAQAVLQGLSSNDPIAEVKTIPLETPKRYSWNMKRFDCQIPFLSDDMPQPPVVFPAYLWRVAWKLLPLEDSQESTCCMSWRAGSNRRSPWLVLCFREPNAAQWKTLSMRDVQVVVQTLSADVNEESLQCLLQSKAWEAILFVDGVQVFDISSAVEVFVLSLRVVPLCGKLLAKIHPSSRIILLTRGSQLVQKHTCLSFIHVEDAPPHAAGMLGFTRALRAELSYSSGKLAPLYFVDLDPASSLSSSVNALPAMVHKLKADEQDIAVRQGNVYVPRLWPAAQLHCDAGRTPEESSYETESTQAVNAAFQVEKTALSKCSESCCPAWTVPNHFKVTEKERGLDVQLASSGSEGLAPCACRVRLMSVCTDNIRHPMDRHGESIDVLVGCSGIIVAVGSQVERFRVGDTVCGFAPSRIKKKPPVISTTCSYLLQPIPQSFSFEAAAATPTQLAQIMRTAGVRAHEHRKRSSATLPLERASNISLPETEKGSEKPLIDTDKKSNADASSTGTCLLEHKLAYGAREPRWSNTGSGIQQHGRSVHSELGPGKVAEYGRGTKITRTLQSTASPCVGDGKIRNTEVECARQKSQSTDDDIRQCTYMKAGEDSSIPFARVVDWETTSGGGASRSQTHCSRSNVIIVDGSGAGLTAAIYFHNNGYEVIGVPVSKEQQQALEALNVQVAGAAGVNAEPEEGDTASGLSLVLGGIPSAESEVQLPASSERTAVPIQENAEREAGPGNSGLSAVKYTTLCAAENGVAHKDAAEPGAHAGDRIASGDAAVEELAKANTPEAGFMQRSENPVTEYLLQRKKCCTKTLGEFPAPTDFHICSPPNRLVYCTLRSQNSVEQLLPWMVEGSTIYDFSCSENSAVIEKRLQIQANGVRYCNGGDGHYFRSGWPKAYSLDDALRLACDLLKEELACYSLVVLHVFLDSALDEGSAFQEACDFSDAGTHAGNVVCTYSNPILHVPSVLVDSPASNDRDIPEYPAVTHVERTHAKTARGTVTQKLPGLPGKGFLHTDVTLRKGQDVCHQQHGKWFADSPDNTQKAFLVTAGLMGDNLLVSAEERRNATYIVSGNTRGLSVAVARWLLEEGALHVVLLHEETMEEQMEGDNEWSSLERANTAARIVALTCSFQSKESTENAFRLVREELHFPPVRGIIHVPCDAQPELTDNEDNIVHRSRSVLERRALAAWNLHYVLNELHMEESLQLFVLFSGISGLFGSIKREAVCASNTALDMLACYRTSQGLSGLSIQWASWLADTSKDALSRSRAGALACESEPLLSAWLTKGGITGVPDGLCALRQILTLYISGQIGAVVACFGVNPTLVEKAVAGNDGWMPTPAASLNVQRKRSPADSGGLLRERLLAGTGNDTCSEYKDVLYELVNEEVCRLVGFYVAREKDQKLRPDQTLSSLGMDSLAAAELKYELQSRFRMEYDSQVVHPQATIETIAGCIFSHLCFQFCLSLSDDPNGIKGSNTRDSIAVVSMGLRLPGGCCCPGTLWGMLLSSSDCSRGTYTLDAPTARDSRSRSKQRKLSFTTKAIRACYLDGADTFDSEFFGLGPPEVLVMDRQARLLVEVAYEALFNINLRDTVPQSGSPVAVYTTGFLPREYPGVVQDDEPYSGTLRPQHRQRVTDTCHKTSASDVEPGSVLTLFRSQDTLPGLISYLLSLSGTSVSVSAGEASSLSALCLAADHLEGNTHAEAALVGAVRLLPVELQNSSFSLGSLARKNASYTGGWCAPLTPDDSWSFDHIQGEGAMAVVLQKQRVAEMSANPVLAIIRGRSMKHVGRHDAATKGGVGSCTGAVRSVLEGALASAGATRRDVAVVEVAGVGLSAHPHHLEWEAIAQVYGKETSTSYEFPTVVSSIKGNVGCLREAAGLAGFLKVVLMLAQSRPSSGGGWVFVPPSLRLEQICESMRSIANNGCEGLLLPSKPFVRRPLPAAAASHGIRSRFAGGDFGVSAEESYVVSETILSAAEPSVQHIKGLQATLPAGELGHPHETTSSSVRQSFVSMPGASTYSVPSGESCENSVVSAVLRRKPEDRVLGGVTATAHSGFVVHMLIEGAAPTLEPAVSFTGTSLERTTTQHFPIITACGPVTDVKGNHADRGATDSCSARSAIESAAVPGVAGGCLNAVGSSKRCLWLFSDDYTNLLYCARPLYFTNKIFAHELDRCSELMSRYLPTGLRQLLYPRCEAELRASERFLCQPHVAPLSLFALQWSMANYLRRTCQGRSVAVTGVGVGETVAAAVAGLLSLDKAINLVVTLSNTQQSHTHTTDLQTSTTLWDEKVVSSKADARLLPMDPSRSQIHTVTNADYGLSTDGEQTNRSDYFSLYDDPDASCRSLLWNNGVYPTNGFGREHSRQEQSGLELVSVSQDCTELADKTQNQAPQPQPFANHVSASSLLSNGNDDDKSYHQEQEAALETPTCNPVAIGRPLEMLKQRSSVAADIGAKTSGAVSRDPGEAIRSVGNTRVLICEDDFLRPFSAPVNVVGQSASVSLPERVEGPYDEMGASRRVEPEKSKMGLHGSRLGQERRRGSCCIPASRHAPTPTLRCRGGSLVEQKVTDTPQHSITASSCIPILSPSSFSDLTHTPPQRRTSVDGVLRSNDTREEEPLRDGGRCRSTVNKTALPYFPQVCTSTPRRLRTSLQYVTPVHAKIFSQAMQTGPLVGCDSVALDRRVTCLDKQIDNQTRGIVSLNLHPERVSEKVCRQDAKPCSAEVEGRTPLQGPSVNHLVAGTYTPSARSSRFYTVSGRERVPASSQDTKDAQPRNFTTSNAALEGFSKGMSRCLRCEEIRNIVGKTSVKQAACVFLSASFGAAIPDSLLRDPLYWSSTPPQKLHLRTTVKVAKKVLRAAAVVVLGPPAAGPLHPGALLKLAKYVEIFRFTGRSDSPEAVFPCEVSTSIERAAAVCSDIVLRTPHAVPCWKHVNTQPLGACELRDVNIASHPVAVPREADQIPRRAAQSRRRDFVARLPGTLSA